MDDQDPDFSDGNSDGQELGGAVDSNEYHTLSASANNISDNRYAQNYINYSNVICSNLMADGNGYIRVEADDSSLMSFLFSVAFTPEPIITTLFLDRQILMKMTIPKFFVL